MLYSLDLLRYQQQLGQLNAKQAQPKAATAATIASRDPVSGDLILLMADGGVTRQGRA